MNITYLDGNEANVKRLARAVFPHYRGRKFSFQVVETVALTGTYWDGGSRSSYGGVSLADYSAATVPQFEPPQFGGPTQAPTVEVKPGMVVVEHSIFCGRDTGITFYVHPSDAPQLLPEPDSVTEDEKIVLLFTGSLKYTEAHSRYGITADRWTAAQEALKVRKLLRANGSITPAGRNVDTGEYRC
mgnify:CR=1 FL=1